MGCGASVKGAAGDGVVVGGRTRRRGGTVTVALGKQPGVTRTRKNKHGADPPAHGVGHPL